MKSSNKITMTLIILLTGSFLMGVIFYSGMAKISISEYFLFGVIIILALFGFYSAYKHFQLEKSGINPNDEFQIRVSEKAAFKAFFASIYLWILILILFSDSRLDFEIIIGLGMMGMFVIFIGYSMYYKKFGVDRPIEK